MGFNSGFKGLNGFDPLVEEVSKCNVPFNFVR